LKKGGIIMAILESDGDVARQLRTPVHFKQEESANE